MKKKKLKEKDRYPSQLGAGEKKKTKGVKQLKKIRERKGLPKT